MAFAWGHDKASTVDLSLRLSIWVCRYIVFIEFKDRIVSLSVIFSIIASLSVASLAQ